MYLVYNLLLTFLSPIWLPWMFWRTKKRKESPNWNERQGMYDATIPPKEKGQKRVWVHAVSVGEVIAAKPFIEQIRLMAPETKVILSVTTSSGNQTARDSATGLYDYLVYFPLDFARFQLRAMQRVRPDAIAIMETELWFNFLWAADVFDVPTFVINGRSSDRAFKRSMKFKWFFKQMLSYVQKCLVQTETDRERFEALGAKSVEVFGNTKFDEAVGIANADSSEWREKLCIPQQARVVVVGSTRSEMEERLVVEAFFNVKNVFFVHAPRHLETATRIKDLFDKLNPDSAHLKLGFRSKGETGKYLILDTYGELGSVYSVADVVVIGGGFDQLGGQNLIQPLALGKPILHGPNMFNFRDVAATAVSSGASKICNDSAELSNALRNLLDNEMEREAMCNAAKQLVVKNVGASERYAQVIVSAINK